MLSCFPAVILELLIEPLFGNLENMNLLSLFMYVLIDIALVEELCKWFMTYKIAYNNKEFNHLYDAIVYCVFVSLGFASLENVLYVLSTGIGTGILRAVTAIPGHTCYAVIMGNYLGLSKIAQTTNNIQLAKRNLFLSIIIPSVVHAIYNYCLFTEKVIFLLLFILVLIAIYIYGIRKIKKISKIENNFQEDITVNRELKHCHECNLDIVGNYCSNCGKELVSNAILNGNNLTQ